MVFKPFVKFVASVRTDLLSMFSSIVACMVDGKEEGFGFSTAGASIPAVSKDGLFLQSIIVGKRVLPAFIAVLTAPLRNFGDYFFPMAGVILALAFSDDFLGFVGPVFEIFFAAIVACAAPPTTNFYKIVIGFLFTALFARFHGVIIPWFDYANQESVTTIPSGSTPQAIGGGSAYRPIWAMI